MIREIDGSPLDPAVWGNKASELAKLVTLAAPVPPAICLRVGAIADTAGLRVVKSWISSHPASSYILRSSSLTEDLDSSAGAGTSITLSDIAGDATLTRELVINQLEPALQGGSVILQVQANCLYAGVAFVDQGIVAIEAGFRSLAATTSGEPPALVALMAKAELKVRLDRTQINQPVIGILHQVGNISKCLSKHYGERVNLEWVHDGISCWIVQARPLTCSLEL